MTTKGHEGDAERIVRIAAEHKADVLDTYEAVSPLCGHLALNAVLSTGSTIIACYTCPMVGIRAAGVTVGIARDGWNSM